MSLQKALEIQVMRVCRQNLTALDELSRERPERRWSGLCRSRRGREDGLRPFALWEPLRVLEGAYDQIGLDLDSLLPGLRTPLLGVRYVNRTAASRPRAVARISTVLEQYCVDGRSRLAPVRAVAPHSRASLVE